jgi:hypothetical protein
VFIGILGDRRLTSDRAMSGEIQMIAEAIRTGEFDEVG